MFVRGLSRRGKPRSLAMVGENACWKDQERRGLRKLHEARIDRRDGYSTRLRYEALGMSVCLEKGGRLQEGNFQRRMSVNPPS